MKVINILSVAAGAAAGALAMYYLDPDSGRRRRALVRDRMVAAGHDTADFAEMKFRRTADRLKGVVATRHLDRITRARPGSDEQLHDRIRARIGHVVSHPKSIEVEVQQGCVCLKGSILTREVDALVREVRRMAGVETVLDRLTCHDTAEHVPELQGGRDAPPGRQQHTPGRRDAQAA